MLQQIRTYHFGAIMSELTIPIVIARQNEIFGRRNRLYFTSRDRRILFLIKGANELAKQYRSHPGNEKALGGFLVRVLTRIMCLAEHYGSDMPLAQAFANKWLGETCHYCQCLPCTCSSESRPDPIAISSDRSNWTFSQIAAHLNELYGPVNNKRSIEYLILRLSEECGETSSAVIASTRSEAMPEAILYGIAKELADGIAWTFSVANRVGIDLEKEYLARYSNGCRACGNAVCQCSEFDFTLREAISRTS
jgi:NTP pyrophosphatase (non-canonical NTP hydrolase)